MIAELHLRGIREADGRMTIERVEADWPSEVRFSTGWLHNRVHEDDAEFTNGPAFVWLPPFLTIRCRNGRATYRLEPPNPFTRCAVGTLVECTPA